MNITPNLTSSFGVPLCMKVARLRSILHSRGARRHVQPGASRGASLTCGRAKARFLITRRSAQTKSSATSFETKEIRT